LEGEVIGRSCSAALARLWPVQTSREGPKSGEGFSLW